MASPSSSTGPLHKEEYTPDVAEHRPVDPLSEDAVKDNDGEDDFDTRTIQDAPPPPTVSGSQLMTLQ